MAATLAPDKLLLLDMLNCARRELAIRKSVYPSFVKGGRMSAATAERETALMAAVVAHFERELGVADEV